MQVHKAGEPDQKGGEPLFIFCFKNKVHSGPYFSSLKDFVANYQTSSYTRHEEHMLDEPLDPVSGDARASVREIMVKNEIGKVKLKKIEWYKSKAFWGVISVLVYFTVGCLYYCLRHDWALDEAIYFAVVVATTVGYGDNQSIVGHEMMLFTTFYVLSGVAIVLASATTTTATSGTRTRAHTHTDTQRCPVAAPFTCDFVLRDPQLMVLQGPHVFPIWIGYQGGTWHLGWWL